MSKTAFAPPAPSVPKLKPQAERFVKGAGKRTPAEAGKIVRITLDLPSDLHRALKIEALDRGVTMVDVVRGWIEQNCNK